MTNRIIIIGGGFAGLSAARRIFLSGMAFDGVIIDRKKSSDFLPVLPDCLGRGIDPDCLAYPIGEMCKKTGFKFINEEVISVDIGKKQVSTSAGALGYDFLIIASGSETNFYGNDNIRQGSYKLDDVRDAENIARELKKTGRETYIVGGGGYTGVEVAANLAIFLNSQKLPRPRIMIVERSADILGPLPEWMKSYVRSNLERLKVEVLTGSQIEKIDGPKVYISGVPVLNNALVIWAAGVKTASFIQNLDVKKNPQGRIEVDEYLRLDKNCFVAGDASYVRHGDIFLRMSVQFAIAQGDRAARNTVNTIKSAKLRKYKPVDLGYIIPMANNISCGTVFGINVKGILATLLHFAMCLYRSWSLKNRICLMRSLIH